MKKVLIDSDICLDVFLRREPFVKNSAMILSAAEKGNITAVVSGVSFDNIFYVLRKNSNTAKAIERIRKLREVVEIGIVTEFSIDRALNAGWNDFEDAIQYFCALENNCESIITRNPSDYQNTEIGIFEPAHFIEISGLQ